MKLNMKLLFGTFLCLLLNFSSVIESQLLDNFNSYQQNAYIDTNYLQSYKHLVSTSNLRYPFAKTNNQWTTLFDLKSSSESSSNPYSPGLKVKDFSLPTISGTFNYSVKIDHTSHRSVLISVFNPHSGFLQCLWNCSHSLEDLLCNSPLNVNYLFFSTQEDAYQAALWMKRQFIIASSNVLKNKLRSQFQIKSVFDNLHFVTIPVYEAGNWIPEVLKEWMCFDHNCGLAQVVFTSEILKRQLTLPRLDAHYDWLPSPESSFKIKDKVFSVTYIADACQEGTKNITGAIALVKSGGCSYFTMIFNMKLLGAVGVIIMSEEGIKDLNCAGVDCDLPLNVPAVSINYNDILTRKQNLKVKFQTTAADNFFLGIDMFGQLAEVGWFLYPSMNFLAWQAQWFNYKAEVIKNVSLPAYVVNVFNHTIMQGASGAVNSISLPQMAELRKYKYIYIDASLSCPGDLDRDCPHWDHTVSLSVNCQNNTYYEMGRWITAFRRRIGRWLTDVSHLLPLLEGSYCTFVMKTAPWAMAWKPSLNLRFSGTRNTGEAYPYKFLALFNGGNFIFDKSYNSKFPPIVFEVPKEVVQVHISATITGHGSDENGCGEFCNTTHHFVINKKYIHTISFNISGTPLGCADKVKEGVTPNEHGTWLYGRDGWCDGQDVKPWLFDITNEVNKSSSNLVEYYGYFNGTDPNPKQNPGVMIVSSYLIYYRTPT